MPVAAEELTKAIAAAILDLLMLLQTLEVAALDL